MEQYIPKSALVAEINKLRKTSLEYGYTAMSKVLADTGKDLALGQLLHNLDTLEVKEVDLKKEINGYFKGWGDNEVGCFAMMQDGTSVGVDDCIDIAKHFFELGLKAQKGEEVCLMNVNLDLKEEK